MIRCTCYFKSPDLDKLCPLCESRCYVYGSPPNRRLEWRARIEWPWYALRRMIWRIGEVLK